MIFAETLEWLSEYKEELSVLDLELEHGSGNGNH